MMHAARAVWRGCSLRNFVALATGGVLVGAPGIAGPTASSFARVLHPPQYPHQAEAQRLAGRRMHVSGTSRAWVEAAERAVAEALPVELPWTARAALDPAVPAAGYGFSVPVGRRLSVSVGPAAAGSPAGELYVDLFRRDGARLERVGGGSAGSAAAAFALDALEGGDYVLRAQPPPGMAVESDVDVRTAALLAFPVDGVDGRAIWSGFGAERDGGRRAHRGVDIFAARGTPVLAAVDGWVTRVETTRVGGNVVWMQPLFGNLRLYYAHLDEQWVLPGAFVRTGQALGSVGNTGNARTTPPHLHFGVYVRRPGMRGGAQDPVDFLR
jgi:murein DD-endopeptidase MepM/ murein hydrolase activator NlpD